MHITFIGTGSGKTSLNRFHSSFIIESEDHSLLVDAGDGVSRALLNQHINFHSINSVLITHFHSDHIAGITSLINQMYLRNRENSLTIYVHQNMLKLFLTIINAGYIFPEKLKFDLNIETYQFDQPVILAENIKFTPRQNSHISNKHKIRYKPETEFVSSCLLFELGGHNVFYTSDVGSSEDLYLFRETNINLLIAETTHLSHDDILLAVSELKPDSTYLTHIDESDEAVLIDFVNSHKASNIILACDGLKISI